MIIPTGGPIGQDTFAGPVLSEAVDEETYPAASWLLEHGFSFDINLILDPNR